MFQCFGWIQIYTFCARKHTLCAKWLLGGIAVDLPRSPAGPSPNHPATFPTALLDLPQIILTPSPNTPATFPAALPDLPHGIHSWRHSELLLLGKVHHPFREGLLSPRGPSPSLRPSRALRAHSLGESLGERQMRMLRLDSFPPYCHFDIFGFQPGGSDKLRDGSIHCPVQVGGNAHFLVFGQFRQIRLEP